MIVFDPAQKGLSEIKAPLPADRGTELAALSSVTHNLRSAAEVGPAGFAQMALALHENRRLWQAFAASVSDRNNLLPDALRARLFYLAEFTEHHSRMVLRGNAAVDVLVEINDAVMRGLGVGAPA